MKTITKKYEVFIFDELRADAKARAIEKHQEFLSNFSYEGEYIISYFMERHKLSSDVFSFEYSGFCSQGDGGRFCFKSLEAAQLKPFLKHLYQTNKSEYSKFYRLCSSKDFAIIWNKNSFGHHYAHENTFYLSAVSNESMRFDALFEGLAEDFQSYLSDLSKKLYKELEADYFAMFEDANIIEDIKANEYLFLSNGDIFNE